MCNKHLRHICLGQPENSAMAQYKSQADHNIKFSHTIVGKALGHMDHLTMEANDTKFHPSNFNKDRCFNLSQSWYLVTNMIKQYPDELRERTSTNKFTTPPTNTPSDYAQFQS
jgi:hypothetical protein